MTRPDARDLSTAELPAAVTEVLAEFLESRRAETARIGAAIERAGADLRDFVLGGGKRLRPVFGWVGFTGCGGLDGDEDPQAVLRAVAALEFIQGCALIHDDIIDASDTRRGHPTVHRVVEARHRAGGWLGQAEHFGESAAILTGDLALVWAEDMLQDSGLSDAALRRVRAPWRAMRTEVIGGQLLDITLEAQGSESLAAAESVNRFKTAAYTIERPLHLGAALAGADSATVEALRGYGRDIGVAFQLRDDVLGVFGDPQVTGKPAGDDIREGKRTVLLAQALATADASDPAAAATLRAGIGSADPATIAEVTALIDATGARRDVEKRIDELFASGLDRVAGLPEATRADLEELAVAATARHR